MSSFSTLRLFLFFFLLELIAWTGALPLLPRRNEARRGFDIAFSRIKRSRSDLRRADVTGDSGLGDNSDLLYSVPIEIGNLTTAVHLDTGSSDLWVITDECTTGTCAGSSSTRFSSPSFNDSGVDVTMFYGDSLTGTQAIGEIGYETTTIAGVAVQNQPFAAVNYTTNTVVKYSTSGIFGLGFPSGSKIQEAVIQQQFGGLSTTDDFVAQISDEGPILSRIVMSNQLEQPLFSISLQRSTIDIGGGNGMLTVGKLPDGVDNSSLTWVPVRLYTPEEGGMRPPSFAPDEIYPFRWEIDIDGVFFDGQQMPASTINATGGVNGTRVSGLIDTGNSLIRGPSDVVNNILSSISSSYNPNSDTPSATFPCLQPHSLAFQIGGKMFSIEPRDFIGQSTPDNVETCVADNLVPTDPPGVGALFRWSLGDPFLKSNLVAFYYGNLTHPSVDPPRIGILSTVPSNASSELTQAVEDAQTNGGNFETTIEAAPTASAATEGQTTVTPLDFSIAFTSQSASTPAALSSAATPVEAPQRTATPSASSSDANFDSSTVTQGNDPPAPTNTAWRARSLSFSGIALLAVSVWGAWIVW